MTRPAARTTTGGAQVKASPVLRVLVVDDRDAVREGLRSLLGSRAGIATCGEAVTLPGAVEVAQRTEPDVVVADVHLADAAGIQAARAIRGRRSETQILLLTAFADDDALFATILAGASGYLLHQVAGGQLVGDLDRVVAGELRLDPAVVSGALDRLRELLASHDVGLSIEEEQVLSLIAEGKTDGEIASRARVSPADVEQRVASIVWKLAAARDAETALWRRSDWRPDGTKTGSVPGE